MGTAFRFVFAGLVVGVILSMYACEPAQAAVRGKPPGLCHIQAIPPTWKGRNPVVKNWGLVYGRVEVVCWRRVVHLKVSATLVRSRTDLYPPGDGEPLFEIQPIDTSTAHSFGDTRAVATVSHRCQYTTVEYFFRVTGYATVEYIQRGSNPPLIKTERSRIAGTAYIPAVCF